MLLVPFAAGILALPLFLDGGEGDDDFLAFYEPWVYAILCGAYLMTLVAIEVVFFGFGGCQKKSFQLHLGLHLGFLVLLVLLALSQLPALFYHDSYDLLTIVVRRQKFDTPGDTGLFRIVHSPGPIHGRGLSALFFKTDCILPKAEAPLLRIAWCPSIPLRCWSRALGIAPTYNSLLGRADGSCPSFFTAY